MINPMALREKEGLWRIAREIEARRRQVEKSIVKYIRRWMNGNWFYDFVKAEGPPSNQESKATQTEPNGEDAVSSYFEVLYDAVCRERDMWQFRSSELLDLILCKHCEEEKMKCMKKVLARKSFVGNLLIVLVIVKQYVIDSVTCNKKRVVEHTIAISCVIPL